jgi:hypothetical protein
MTELHMHAIPVAPMRVSQEPGPCPVLGAHEP